MAAIQRFEDIEAWKEARKLTTEVYRLTEEGAFRSDYGLRDQLRRAAVSVMANIAEGFDGGSRNEFIKFLGYSLRSTTEVQSHLYVALDQSYVDEARFRRLYESTVKVKNLTSGFMRYLKGSTHARNEP